MHPLYELPLHSKERKTAWKELVSEWKTSGISQTSFCKARGLKPLDFSRWLCRLNKKEKINNKIVAPLQNATNFIPIEIISSSINKTRSIKLEHINGWSLEIPTDFEEDIYSKIMNLLLRPLPC